MNTSTKIQFVESDNKSVDGLIINTNKAHRIYILTCTLGAF